jgi:hypothetical protein
VFSSTPAALQASRRNYTQGFVRLRQSNFLTTNMLWPLLAAFAIVLTNINQL